MEDEFNNDTEECYLDEPLGEDGFDWIGEPLFTL